MNWSHHAGTWSVEVVVSNDTYWGLVKEAAEVEQSPEEYLADLADSLVETFNYEKQQSNSDD